MIRIQLPAPMLLGLLAASLAPTANAHFLWITIDQGSADGSRAIVRTFLEEEPVPGSEKFLKHIEGVALRAAGQKLPLAIADNALAATWLGRLPETIDADRDMGVSEKNGIKYRLMYTARAQVGVADPAVEESAGLRVRMVKVDDKILLRVTFDGVPTPNARLMSYGADGAVAESRADERGLAALSDVAAGRAGVWANHVVTNSGAPDREGATETRHYATLTYCPERPSPEATTYATLPDPAVNSFGGATLGDWLYVYSGHVGRMHDYHEGTTTKTFRRLDLTDRTTWQDLPMTRDVQGVALVADGRFLYRIGGMVAVNQKGEPEDTRSIADFARFDPTTMTWVDLAPMPKPRSTHDAIVFENTVYVFGGWTLNGLDDAPEYCNEALAFDLDQPDATWRTIAQPFRRRALAVAEQDGKLYVLGGLQSNSKTTKRVDVFDPKTATWSEGPSLPGADEHEGFGPSAFAVDGRLYYSGASGIVFSLAKSGDAFEPVGSWNEPRITHRLLPGRESELLAVGGNFARRQTARIEVLRLAPDTLVATPSQESAPTHR